MSDDRTVDGPDGDGRPAEVGPPTSGQGNDVAATTAVVRLVGEVDISAAGLVRRQLFSHIRATEDAVVVVDLSEVTFMDCAGLEPLLSADRWLVRRNRRLLLRPVSARVVFLLMSLRRADLLPLLEQPELPRSEDLSNDVTVDLADEADLIDVVDRIHAAEIARLRRAFEGRPLIDQATGVLMSVHECAAAEALGWLTGVAQQHNMTAGDLAAGLAGLAAARGGRSTLDLSPAMKAAVRGVLAHPGRSPAAKAGLATAPLPRTTL
jgi:anti-anti-sigma factor